MQTNNEPTLTRFFGRQVVGLVYRQFCPSPPYTQQKTIFGLITCFVIEIEGRWFFVSVGHVFDPVKEAIEAGAQFRWSIIDSVGDTAVNDFLVPFAGFTGVPDLHIFQGNTDFAFISVDAQVQQMMVKNNFVPFTEQEIALPVPQGEFGDIVVGFPSELMQFATESEVLKVEIVGIGLQNVHVPAASPTVLEGNLYDFTQDPNPIRSIKGMSGGPWLRTWPDSNGDTAYKPIGIQSKWDRQSVTTAYSLDEALKELRQALQSGKV